MYAVKCSLKETLHMHSPGPLAPVLNWVNPRMGPITRFRGMRLQRPEPPWWLYQGDLVRTIGKFFTSDTPNALGCSLDPNEAMLRALGEAVERYTGYNSLLSAELQQLKASESELLHLFPYCLPDEACSDSFKGLGVGYTDDTPLTHTPAKRLKDGNDGRTYWIPAGTVHMSFWAKAPEPLIALPTSAGLSFYSNRVQAIWSGLLELAERDQMMIFWLNKVSIPRLRIEKESVGRDLWQRVSLIEKSGTKVHLFSMTRDFPIPAVFCILESERFPYYVAGASAHENAEVACSGAIDEAMAIRFAQFKFGSDAEVPSFTEFDWVKSFTDHANLYANWPNSPALDFLLKDNRNEVSLQEYKNRKWLQAPASIGELANVARILEDIGLTILWSDLTSTEASELGVCVKVTVPEMVPLIVAHKVRWLASPRLRNDGPSERRAKDFNHEAHPFP